MSWCVDCKFGDNNAKLYDKKDACWYWCRHPQRRIVNHVTGATRSGECHDYNSTGKCDLFIPLDGKEGVRNTLSKIGFMLSRAGDALEIMRKIQNRSGNMKEATKIAAAVDAVWKATNEIYPLYQDSENLSDD